MKAPHDPLVERAVLAAMLRYPDTIESAVRSVDAGDFYSPAHGAVFDAVVSLWGDGVKPDAATVLDRLRGVVDPSVVLEITASEASTSAFERHAQIVVAHSTRRKLLAASVELREAAFEGDPHEVLDAHVSRLEQITLPQTQAKGLMLLDELLDAPETSRADWVVPGLLRRDWRVVVVAPEGAGKTLMLQQVALAASQGVHPFSFKRGLRPARVLLIDTENPADRVKDGCGPIREVLRRMNDGWESSCHIVHRPDGINLRSRRTVAEIEDVLYGVRPDLVCAGPNYKLAERLPGEGWDEQARAVMTVFDKLRTRFGFALLLEDHAPQAQNGSRDLRPFGSSMWLRWPELGWKFLPRDNGDLVRGEWRMPRLAHGWPDELHRGGQGSLPWVGYWKDGFGG